MDGNLGAILLWGVAGLAALLLLIWVVAGVVHARRKPSEPPAPTPPPGAPPRPHRVITESGTLAPAGSLLRPDAEPQRYSWDEPRSHRRFSRWPVAFATVAVLAAVAGGMTWLQRDRDAAADRQSAEGCPDTILRVAAAPEIAPVIEAAARKLAPEGATCGPVYVGAEEPSTVGSGVQKPDVWIPSSSAWLDLAAAGGTTYDTKGGPLARSPIVIAAPAKTAARFAKKDKTSWAALIDSVSKQRVKDVAMPDPQHNTVGMLSVYAVQAAMNKTTPDDGIAQLRALTLRSRLTDANADPSVLLRDHATEVFPTTEQQLAKDTDLTTLYPQDAMIEADYPYAISRTTKQRDLANKLRAAITTKSLTAAGFRAEADPRALKLPDDPSRLTRTAQQWSQYRTFPFQVLLLVDGSGSMNQKVTDKGGRVTTKATLLRESGANANTLFGDDTSIGMWYFSSPTPESTPHVEAVPLGPLTDDINGKSRREVMGAAMAAYKAVDDAGTPLYRTVLDGVDSMRSKAKEGTMNIVIVLTDGQDEESDFTMTQQAFLDQLQKDADPRKPVPVIAVGLGQDADMNALNAMAKATGGQAISATNPADVASAIAQAFLAAHAPR
ncbi:substrate-binding and VWA domain-containing protein [Symbioplanes lichenis]|uniref:substrate-binding and VWA domain-containing protein n=1 Tax=Symbioplanes lichenis TaxID=1629072 RepID=UPI002738585F|nr:substrate-binding and VWA domain-containing protein [Actinoplanes lichenis]